IWVAAMGKSKRAKDLTHEEIWDDSALVRSWDDAVEEYQLYHSIQAKGENVEDVLKQAEEECLPHEDPSLAAVEDNADDVSMEAETEDGAGAGSISQVCKYNQMRMEPTDKTQALPSVPQAQQQSVETAPTPAAAQGPTGAMPMPEAILSQVQDENLKRLMMSWYYAGYYTGLYEGQQQANQGKS
ncbi:hypothetical protein N7448_000959, partial [Penicillium atrosanguineum]